MLQPHRSETFKLSTDPLFVEKVRDIVGLYLDPPDRALVLCVDEKSQIQALDRTQPLLPMRPGQAERRTHDYKRHGTTSLFAALDAKAGTVIGRCMPRHRAQEFRRFLDTVENSVPADLDVHVILDNASSHKTKLIRDWFAKRARWHTHFTPTSASWINQVERFFALLGEQQIKRGAHRSTKDWKRPSPPILMPAMPTPSLSAGPKPPMISSRPSNGSAAAPDFPRTSAEFQSRFVTEDDVAGISSSAAGRTATSVHDVLTPRRTFEHAGTLSVQVLPVTAGTILHRTGDELFHEAATIVWVCDIRSSFSTIGTTGMP